MSNLSEKEKSKILYQINKLKLIHRLLWVIHIIGILTLVFLQTGGQFLEVENWLLSIHQITAFPLLLFYGFIGYLYLDTLSDKIYDLGQKLIKD